MKFSVPVPQDTIEIKISLGLKRSYLKIIHFGNTNLVAFRYRCASRHNCKSSRFRLLDSNLFLKGAVLDTAGLRKYNSKWILRLVKIPVLLGKLNSVMRPLIN